MIWNEGEGYVNYSTSLTSIQNILKLSYVDFYLRPELSPYVTYILQYLNSRLILLGDNLEFKIYLQEVFDTFDHGADMIVAGAALDLALEVGIDTGDVYIEGEQVPYCQDRFVFCWSNVFTSLCTLIRLTYSGLFDQEEEDCPCECGGKRINANKENDEWTSGIYSEDENYDWYSKVEVVKTGWNVSGSYFDQCTKCNRKY